MTLSPIRKIFQGVADRRQMFRLFDRHEQRPNAHPADDQHLYVGEWFEISPENYQYMFDILPPLWMEWDMFALSRPLTGALTSIFFNLKVSDRPRYFHGYCDLSDRGSPERMKQSIIVRESRPVCTMTRDERLEHIWSITHDDYRGYAGERWPIADRGKRTVLFYGGRHGSLLKLLDRLTDDEIAAKLPVHLRYLPEAIAA
ncbi:hypothetical protein OCA5_pHCG300860 (plasmid) [Afipia carboxidovorans OM5]|uniref:DUF1419 domain-containing protein n=1 Tax=Afipia carboxidovorans (strain ATCC 49405 / DSM 1227 / KCTC 32145 / OM5) TaxID=504832 RepID=Q6LB72_AFIC5|nr:DUF1419 domain-containing protein [Afipia carboxidovorans]AEI04531.1 hypothetical protein OCA4_pHCG3B00860 [Afipia carboxidovorans OM4]AEI08159.1 hypothetical protein OCA5_pHCG300860 [Afipia carboxidovorans OM5]